MAEDGCLSLTPKLASSPALSQISAVPALVRSGQPNSNFGINKVVSEHDFPLCPSTGKEGERQQEYSGLGICHCNWLAPWQHLCPRASSYLRFLCAVALHWGGCSATAGPEPEWAYHLTTPAFGPPPQTRHPPATAPLPRRPTQLPRTHGPRCRLTRVPAPPRACTAPA